MAVEEEAHLVVILLQMEQEEEETEVQIVERSHRMMLLR